MEKSSLYNLTRQAMYTHLKTEVLSCNNNNFCRGKAINNSHSECVSVALVIQHEKRMRRVTCHLWPVSLYHIEGLSKRFEHLLLWPPRSPDLTPCDFFLWGYVKDNAYKPQTTRSHSSCGANH